MKGPILGWKKSSILQRKMKYETGLELGTLMRKKNCLVIVEIMIKKHFVIEGINKDGELLTRVVFNLDFKDKK